MYTYKNGNYLVTIMNNGTKIRMQPDDNADFVPSFAESMDITITQKCDGGCEFCYAGCTPYGEHADLFKYNFINSFHPYTEVALNGNDLSHPQLIDFLKFLKEKKVFANITVNQKHFMQHYVYIKDLQNWGLIHGVGVSYVAQEEFLKYALNIVENTVIHTIAGLLTNNDIEYLSTLNRPLLILGYKYKGRGKKYASNNDNFKNILNNSQWLEDNLESIVNKFPVVSFDNLAIEQLKVKSILTSEQWEEFYMGDEGSATFFIDMVKGTFARSSMDTEDFLIKPNDVIDNVDKMFNFIRGEYGGKINGENKF